jgi:hypothetical protein
MHRSSDVFRSHWNDALSSSHPDSDNAAAPDPEAATNGQWSDRLMSRDKRLAADRTVITILICVTSAEMKLLHETLVMMQVNRL